MTGARTSGGACGLIRCKAKNLTRARHDRSRNPKGGRPVKSGTITGAAWLSSARAVRCWVKSRNERNPRPVLFSHRRQPPARGRKVGMTSSPHGPYALGYTHATMARTRGGQPARGSESRQTSPQLESEAATRLHELGVASNRRSAHCGEYVPGPCTHRPSRHGSRKCLKSLSQPFWEAGAEGGTGDWDEVVTR